MEPFQRIRIKRFNDSSLEEVEDPVAVEQRLKILVNGKEILKLYCTPVMIRELVVGFLMTEGIFRGTWCTERMNIQHEEDEITVDIPAEGEVVLDRATITSGCVGGVTFEKVEEEAPVMKGPFITAKRLFELFEKFQKFSRLYRLTGCVHSAALSDGESILVLTEDIGRHNAVDKVIGYSIMEKISLNDKIMLVSGRLSSEMVIKCSRWAVPILVSRTAPTTRALEIAQVRGITIIGFLRGRRFNIYSHPERVLLS
jgi:FdhD protein